MEDEIFGPILPVIELDSLDSGIDFIKSKDKPLALYLFTKSKDSHKVLENVSFGGGVINDTLIHIANGNLPFGGVGASGMGTITANIVLRHLVTRKALLNEVFHLI